MRPNWAQVGAQHAAPLHLFWSGQQLVLQSHHVDKRLHRVEIGEIHPAVAHAVEERAVPDRLLDDARQSIRRADFLLLGRGQNECAADTGLHGVQIAEFAASDLVHPHPFPRRPEVDDLFGDMAQAAELFAGFLETLGRAGRQIPRRLIRFGAFARAHVEVASPVVRVRLAHGAPKSTGAVKRRNRPGSSSRPHDWCGTAIRPPRPIVSLMTSPLRPNQRAEGSKSEGYTKSGNAAAASAAWDPIPDSGIVPAHRLAPYSAARR